MHVGPIQHNSLLESITICSNKKIINFKELQVKGLKKYKISCISHFCRDLQNVKISALFKKNFCGKNPAIRKLQTFCNSALCLKEFPREKPKGLKAKGYI